MGWASGTDMFDSVVDVVLDFIPPRSDGLHDAVVVKAVVRAMYTRVYWDDWDTQDESKYFRPYLFDVMHELGELDDDYY